MSIIGKKIYSLNIKDNNYYNFGIFSDKIDINSISFSTKISNIINKVQDNNKDADKIEYIGKIIDYSFSVNYEVNIITGEKSKSLSNINFRDFNCFLKIQKGRKIFYIKCEDTTIINYKNIKISAFEGCIYSNNDVSFYLPVKDNKIIARKFNYELNEYMSFDYIFNIRYDCSLIYDNKKFKNEFLRNVDPDHKNFNDTKFGYRILKHYDFGMAYKSTCLAYVKEYIDNEFFILDNCKNNVYEIMKAM